LFVSAATGGAQLGRGPAAPALCTHRRVGRAGNGGARPLRARQTGRPPPRL